jgi:hypothetical protein
MGFDLGSILGSGVGEAVSKIARVFKADPTVIAENQAELKKIEYELQGKLQDAVSREIEAASSNIRAEAGSGDKFTSRARPTFLYICNAVIGWNYIIAPLFGRQPLDLPEPLFWLFGSVMLGYTGARSWEKVFQGKK